jgi:DNA primase large subunit
MNIIDAIKSGKRFRRIAWKISDWVSQDWDDWWLRLTREDVKAEDWEVEEVSCYAGSAMITREQFDKAWHNAFTSNEPYGNLSRDELAKELGL